MLRAPDCAVLFVRTNDTRPYRNILSAVDLRDGSVRAAVAALALFPHANHLIYAVAPALDNSLEASGVASAQLQSLHESMHRHAERELSLLAQGLSAKSMHAVHAEVAGYGRPDPYSYFEQLYLPGATVTLRRCCSTSPRVVEALALHTSRTSVSSAMRFSGR